MLEVQVAHFATAQPDALQDRGGCADDDGGFSGNGM
jgi:hypothetical protein